MKFEEIIKECEGVLEIDETNLSKESLNTPKIYGKVLRIRAVESNIRIKLNEKLKILYREKFEFYLGKADPKVYKEKSFDLKILRSDVDKYIEADEEFNEVLSNYKLQEEKILYLDGILKALAGRNFLIKNAIDFQKMINGGY